MNETCEPAATAGTPPTANPNGQPTLSDRVRALRLKAGGSAASPRTSWLPWGLTVIALATAGVFAWRAYRVTPSDASSSVAGTTGNPGSGQPSDSSTSSTGEVALDNKGIVVAPHSIKISPQVGGEIVWLDPDFKEGAVYKKGEPLAVVDPMNYIPQVKQARADLKKAQVNLQQVETGSTLKDITAAKAMLNNWAAKLEYSRLDERNKRRAGVGTSADDLDKAVIQIAVDQAAHENQREVLAKLETLLEEQRQLAKAQVESARASVALAEKQLSNCTILAPTTGIVLSKNAELGAYVNPLAYSGVAGYLCEMADLLDLEVECDIPERDFKAVKADQKQRCLIMPDAGKDDTEGFRKKHPKGYEGFVARRLPQANDGKGAVTVRVKVVFPKDETAGEFLIPKMGALVQFLK
jgi:multidrug efflux pump subunit AcrA (membrane-fusion protein)